MTSSSQELLKYDACRARHGVCGWGLHFFLHFASCVLEEAHTSFYPLCSICSSCGGIGESYVGTGKCQTNKQTNKQ